VVRPAEGDVGVRIRRKSVFDIAASDAEGNQVDAGVF